MINQVSFYKILTNHMSVRTFMIDESFIASVIAVYFFCTGFPVDNGRTASCAKPAPTDRTIYHATEKINPARRSTLNICVLYFLQIVPFRFCQVSRAVWNPTIGSFVKFTRQQCSHIRPCKIRIIIFLNIAHGKPVCMVLKEKTIKGIYSVFPIWIFYHAFYSIDDSRFVAVPHIHITEDQFSLPDRCFIYEFDTFAGSIHFILANRQDYIQLQSTVSSFHIDSGFTGADPSDVIIVQDFLYLVKIRQVTEPSVNPPEDDHINFSGFYVLKQGMDSFSLF